MIPSVIKRYGPPHKEDTLPQGTICIVEKSTLVQEPQVWEQVSPNADNPTWVLVEGERAQEFKKLLS